MIVLQKYPYQKLYLKRKSSIFVKIKWSSGEIGRCMNKG